MAWIIDNLEDRIRYQLGDQHIRLLAEQKEKEDLQQKLQERDAEIERLRGKLQSDGSGTSSSSGS